MNYNKLVANIGEILKSGKERVYSNINNILVETYWNIGKVIVEFEQKGEAKAEYGTELLDSLSSDLKAKFGKGFSRRNVLDMRRFYVYYPIWQTVSAKLSWSHYVQLISIEHKKSRKFYEESCINENWSIRELNRQKKSALYERVILSKGNKAFLTNRIKKNAINSVNEIVKEPYILEFLGIPENYKYSEHELEQKIIDNL